MSRPQSLMEQLQSLDFQPVDRVLFGPGRLREVGETARALGFRRSIVVTDPGIVRAGHCDRAVEALRQTGVDVQVFDGVEENPTTEHVERGLEVARRHGVDSIVGLGGGSSMDCAKGINFLLTNGGRMEDYRGVGKAREEMLPSLGIPTTAGTGSEAQSFALISDPVTRLKMACGDRKAAFRAVILDPEVTLSMPADVTAATGMDAISHAVESFVTRSRNPISRAFSREAWKLLSESFEKVLDDAEDVEARSAMLLGASLAGMAIENSMLGATHALANPLTATFGVIHGAAVGLMLPHVVRYNGVFCEADYRELAAVSGEDEEVAALDGAEQIARRIETLRQKAGLPDRLESCGVPAARLPELAREAARQWTAQFNPRAVDAGDLEALYRGAC